MTAADGEHGSSLDVLTVSEPLALFRATPPGPLDPVHDDRRVAAGAEVSVATGLARLRLRTGCVTARNWG